MDILRVVQRVASVIGYPVDALVLVLLIFECRWQRRFGDSTSGGAMSVCDLCQELMHSDRTPSRKALRQLSQATSEDVGRVTFSLVRAGLLCAREGLSVAAFVDLFDLRTKGRNCPTP